MSDSSIQLIMTEIHGLRERMDQRFDDQDKVITEHTKQLTELSVQMKSLVGNGQPGRVSKLEDEVSSLKMYRTKLVAYVTVIGGLVTAAFHWLTRSH